MKKLLFILAGLFLLISCDPKQKIDSYDFNKTIESDLQLIANLHQVADLDSIYFLEAQGKFDKNITEEDLKVISVITVWSYDGISILVNHPENAFTQKPNVEEYTEPWVGDLICTVESTIDLNQAIEILKSADIILPESNLFVLRRPLAPPFPENNLYIFGSTKTFFISLDSETGEIAELQTEPLDLE